MEHHKQKKHFWPGGDSNLHCWSQSTNLLCSRPSCIPKKDASTPELSDTVFSHSSNVNSHIMTDAIFVM